LAEPILHQPPDETDPLWRCDPQTIAARIARNRSQFASGEIAYSDWSATQNHLWQMAVQHGVTADVLRLSYPTVFARERAS
jgi:hypothetical protein